MRRGGPRPATRVDRDVRDFPHVHPVSDFTTVGDIFSDETNKDRKKPFDIRTVMRAVADQDHAGAGALGRAWPTPTRRSSWTPTSAATR